MVDCGYNVEEFWRLTLKKIFTKISNVMILLGSVSEVCKDSEKTSFIRAPLKREVQTKIYSFLAGNRYRMRYVSAKRLCAPVASATGTTNY